MPFVQCGREKLWPTNLMLVPFQGIVQKNLLYFRKMIKKQLMSLTDWWKN